MNRPGEKLVWSTRWFDVEADQSDNPLPKPVVQIEVVIVSEAADERHDALSKRPNLFNFLKNEARTHVYA